MSPPPVRHRPSNSSASASVGSTAIGSAPVRRIASRYCSRATTHRRAAWPQRVTAIRGPIHHPWYSVWTPDFGLVAQAGAIDELDEHAVRGVRMKERDQTLDTAARFAIDELDALGRKADERS